MAVVIEGSFWNELLFYRLFSKEKKKLNDTPLRDLGGVQHALLTVFSCRIELLYKSWFYSRFLLYVFTPR